MFLHGESGHVLDVNRRACESLLYSEQELVGMHPCEFDPSVSMAVMDSLQKRLNTGETVVFESVHRRRDGYEFPVEVRLRPFHSEGRRLALALVSDISERREHEAMLERQRQLLVQAQKLAGLGCWDWNLLTQEIWWSEVVYDIFDLNQSEFKPAIEDIFDRILPEDLGAFQASIEEAVSSLRPFRVEARILRPSGELRTLESRGQVFLNDQGQPGHFLGVCWDVTERKGEELAARSTAAALKRAHRIAELEGWTFNGKSGVFGYPAGWNERSLSSEPFSAWMDRVCPEDRQQVEYFWQESLAGYSRELEYRLRDSRWVRTRTEPLLDKAGAVQGLAGTTQDVTTHHHLEEQVREAQKMEAIGRLAGGVAHDYNNMLSVINGYAELLLGESGVGELVLEAAEAIRAAGGRAAELTAQLLAFSRKSPARPQVLDLNRLLRDSAKVLRPLLGENIALELSLEEQPAPIRVDATQFRQLLMNLVLNAREAMAEGGSLSLRTSLPSLTTVQFEVSDTGRGMSEQIRERIFEPFFTSQEVGQGTGMGLAVVHAIVERWGGRISVESRPGQGTTFQLCFPLAESPADQSGMEQPPGSRWGSETVLLVEDEDDVRRMAALALERSGYTVLQADSGSAALELAGRLEVEVLVTDLVMPGMGGIQLADILRQRNPGLKVLFMSGYSEEHLQELGVRLDGTAFLKKPLTPSGLLQRLRAVFSVQQV